MRGARPQREVERAIEAGGVLRRGERVLIACSGGPDSVALTAAMHAVKKPIGISICAAFVNHGLRESAWQDECVVLQVAAQFEIPLEIVALDRVARSEARLRAARYDALIDAANRRRCDVIATAHHAEDQSETVILALLRGAGFDRVERHAGPPPVGAGVSLARPMIGVAPKRFAPTATRTRCRMRSIRRTHETNLRRNAVREALTALRPSFPASMPRSHERPRWSPKSAMGAAGRSCARPCGSNFRLKKIFGTFTSYTSRPRYAPSRPGKRHISNEAWDCSENRARQYRGYYEGVRTAADGVIGRQICSAKEIAAAIERLATAIAADYRRQPLLLLGVLKERSV